VRALALAFAVAILATGCRSYPFELRLDGHAISQGPGVGVRELGLWTPDEHPPATGIHDVTAGLPDDLSAATLCEPVADASATIELFLRGDVAPRVRFTSDPGTADSSGEFGAVSSGKYADPVEKIVVRVMAPGRRSVERTFVAPSDGKFFRTLVAVLGGGAPSRIAIEGSGAAPLPGPRLEKLLDGR
jgi:hypothetical protein